VNIIVFIVVLGALVTLHELGHFILAKRAGIRVEEFGIGFPPRLISFRRGETEYSLNAIPLGGFVRMLGEEDPTAPRSFASAPRLWRIAILAAGAMTNLFVGFLLFSGAYVAGWPTVTKGEVVINRVLPDTPAAQAGLLPGDIIRSFGAQPINTTNELRQAIQGSLGTVTAIAVDRAGGVVNVEVTPRATWPSDQGPVGIGIENHPLVTEPVYYGVPGALARGAAKTVETIALTFELPILVAQQVISVDVARPVGPVGIYQITSQAASETISTGWLFPILSVAATISLGLGIANVLPIPGLDGGRLLFVVIEALRGRRINPQRESMIHFAGLAFLVSAVLVVTYFDVLNPASIDFHFH
jgi:regulator of sigma E protease